MTASALSSPSPRPKLLIAASGTGGHLFPAIATAEQLTDFDIEWLGVPDRMESKLVTAYPLHTVPMAGIQTKLGLGTIKLIGKLATSFLKTRSLLKSGKFQAVFTTGGYISAPAILAARSLGLPVVLHESNVLPGKVTRWLSPLCDRVAVGFAAAQNYLPRAQVVVAGTPVRSQFLASGKPETLPELPIPADVPVLSIVGGSQGAVALNQLVRTCAPAWLEAGIWIVHQTGDSDPEAGSLNHPHYFSLPFYSHIAALFQRSFLVIGRSGAGTLTELAATHTASILVPFPFAAEDHQYYNAKAFSEVGAGITIRQPDLTAEQLQKEVLTLWRSPKTLEKMANAAAGLAVVNSSEQLANLMRQLIAAA
jgi:UDP-N-acetylglucosamine--N-acetylmuramyl-(pentapeptide) pyrophosphoryl-undecaprenol N-acetylglucosamine transferase